MSPTDLRIRTVPSIAEIAAPGWDACANPAAPGRGSGTPATAASSVEEDTCHPLISHAFLNALETSGSAAARTGWRPQHLIAETASGALAGAVPCYLKSHSRGEYVFDQGWAEAYERVGGRYYPKLQAAIPFAPVTGRRLLVRPGPTAGLVRRALASALSELCGLLDVSSAHVTFATEAECRVLGEQGFLQRTDQQFHWHNAGYGCFEDFLSALAARKRKAIRRERREALAAGIEIHWLTGADLTEAVWDAFFAFYMDTGSRKWGRPYLTRKFYSLIGATMADCTLLVMAKRAGRFIAGAINFIGADALYGRHWGAIEHHPFLHFELCYYQAIEFAITRRLRRVEAGAQGEHKLARGYLPVTTHSAHYIADKRLRFAIADYLRHERDYVATAGRELTEAGPFRKNLTIDPG
jgi:uncharacterized protein